MHHGSLTILICLWFINLNTYTFDKNSATKIHITSNVHHFKYTIYMTSNTHHFKYISLQIHITSNIYNCFWCLNRAVGQTKGNSKNICWCMFKYVLVNYFLWHIQYIIQHMSFSMDRNVEMRKYLILVVCKTIVYHKYSFFVVL